MFVELSNPRLGARHPGKVPGAGSQLRLDRLRFGLRADDLAGPSLAGIGRFAGGGGLDTRYDLQLNVAAVELGAPRNGPGGDCIAIRTRRARKFARRLRSFANPVYGRLPREKDPSACVAGQPRFAADRRHLGLVGDLKGRGRLRRQN